MPESCFNYPADVPLGAGNRSAAQTAPRGLPSMPGGHPFISYPSTTCFSYAGTAPPSRPTTSCFSYADAARPSPTPTHCFSYAGTAPPSRPSTGCFSY
jgi:hypothetical protein